MTRKFTRREVNEMLDTITSWESMVSNFADLVAAERAVDRMFRKAYGFSRKYFYLHVLVY